MVGCLRRAGWASPICASSGSTTGPGAPDPAAFLAAHRAELLERRSRLDAALAVPDEKIAHYGTG
ncbi:hypothetical protein [Pseudonocardia sp. NPDC046786]|uniref:hypothetical protein n=1 Tax=Pseudonocardia sp. NPDC046786 TaxID=3155471 RepID=UPI0033E28793